MCWCPNITLVKQVIPHKRLLFSPLCPKTFIATLQCICGDQPVVSRQLLTGFSSRISSRWSSLSLPVRGQFPTTHHHCLWWGFIFLNLHPKTESEHSSLLNKAELGDVSLQLCYLILDKGSRVRAGYEYRKPEDETCSLRTKEMCSWVRDRVLR